MGKPIRTSELSREKLELAYNRMGEELHREYNENVKLKKEIKYLQAECNRLTNLMRYFKKKCHSNFETRD